MKYYTIVTKGSSGKFDLYLQRFVITKSEDENDNIYTCNWTKVSQNAVKFISTIEVSLMFSLYDYLFANNKKEDFRIKEIDCSENMLDIEKMGSLWNELIQTYESSGELYRGNGEGCY